MSLAALRPIVLAICFGSAAPVAAAAPVDPPPLVDTIALWLTVNFDLPAMTVSPGVVAVPEAELVAMRYGPGATVAPGIVVAVYDDVGGTIYLSQGWTGRTAAELSVLVHEMVHHLQQVGDLRFACPGEREVLAYQAQEAWLALFGESLQSAFDIDPAMVRVATVCTH